MHEPCNGCVICIYCFSMNLCCAGRYPNEAILKASLKAADENYITICRQQQVVKQKDTVIQQKDTQLQQKDTQLQQVIQEKQQVCHMTVTSAGQC